MTRTLKFTLTTFIYKFSSGNYFYHVVCYIANAYLSYNWRFVSFNHISHHTKILQYYWLCSPHCSFHPYGLIYFVTDRFYPLLFIHPQTPSPSDNYLLVLYIVWLFLFGCICSYAYRSYEALSYQVLVK